MAQKADENSEQQVIDSGDELGTSITSYGTEAVTYVERPVFKTSQTGP